MKPSSQPQPPPLWTETGVEIGVTTKPQVKVINNKGTKSVIVQIINTRNIANIDKKEEEKWNRLV